MVNLLESNYEEKGKFITYAFQIIKHNFMNEVRRKNHIRARIEENPTIYYNERDVEKERELHKAIRNLQSQRVKECLIVRLMGMENQEAAKILNLNPSTVRGAWARGIKQLRQMKTFI